MTGGFTAVVLTDTRAFLASAVSARTALLSPDALERPRHVLDRSAELIRGNPAGVVMIDGGKTLAEMWQRQIIQHDPAGRVVLVDGEEWGATRFEPWTTWTRRGAPAIHVAFLRSIDRGRLPLFDPEHVEPAGIARRLAWYAHHVGAPFNMTAGVSAHTVIKAQHSAPGKFQQPYWGVRDTARDGDDTRNGSGDLIWDRPPLRSELAGGGWVHQFDMRAARLAAMGVAELPWARLTHTGATAFDEAQAGYWRIHAADVPQPSRRPGWFDKAAVADGMVWLTSPILGDMLAQGVSPDVTDSYTAPARRMLRTVAERWDLARLAALELEHLPELLGAVKATYREGAGMFARHGGSIYRPDWYHTIMDRQRVTVLRHVDRIGRATSRMPVRVHTDALFYVCPESDPQAAAGALGLRLGTRLGMFAVKSTTPVGDYFKRKAGR